MELPGPRRATERHAAEYHRLPLWSLSDEPQPPPQGTHPPSAPHTLNITPLCLPHHRDVRFRSVQGLMRTCGSSSVPSTTASPTWAKYTGGDRTTAVSGSAANSHHRKRTLTVAVDGLDLRGRASWTFQRVFLRSKGKD